MSPQRTDTTATPESLAVRAAAGDRDALAALYARFIDRTVRHAHGYAPNRQTAEDIAQDVWIKVYRSIGTFQDRGEGSFAAWHYQVTVNTCMSDYRRARRRPPLPTARDLELDRPSVDLGPAELHERQQLALEVERALRKIRKAEAQCLVLRIMQGYTIAETAQIMGREPNAIKQLQYRGTRALARHLGTHLLDLVTNSGSAAYSVHTSPPPSHTQKGAESP